jgi:uncharacterized protein YjbJ (UPF0337 family)
MPSWPLDGAPARKDKTMKNSTKDQVQGKLQEVKGMVKQKAGKILHSPGLESEGQLEKTAGKVRQKLGQIEKVLE